MRNTGALQVEHACSSIDLACAATSGLLLTIASSVTTTWHMMRLMAPLQDPGSGGAQVKATVQWEMLVALCDANGLFRHGLAAAAAVHAAPLQACWHTAVVGKRSIAAGLDREPHLSPPQVAKGTARSGSGWEPSSAKTGLNSRIQRPLQSAADGTEHADKSMLIARRGYRAPCTLGAMLAHAGACVLLRMANRQHHASPDEKESQVDGRKEGERKAVVA